MGILEDTATGSAHCVLSPCLAETLARSDLLGYPVRARDGRRLRHCAHRTNRRLATPHVAWRALHSQACALTLDQSYALPEIS
jgi:predicted PhzF superfamily epimerase YddE/YHI9